MSDNLVRIGLGVLLKVILNLLIPCQVYVEATVAFPLIVAATFA